MVVAVQPTDAAAVAAGQVAVAGRAGFRLPAASVAALTAAKTVVNLVQQVKSVQPVLVAIRSGLLVAVLRVAGRPVVTAVLGRRFVVAQQVRAARAVGRQVAATVVVLVRLEAVAEPGGYRLLGNHYPKYPK